ncbi:Nuclear_LIM interactor-interacting factor [Hexamita inflata]|uniref:Mitochondrial import inner membrane translocase subunit TIM50 n=1 Tax=Hexamita inflata TaxID=28002 RepID=A0AA86RNT6_9EUKA|nr:Nuclear LIM interactor-interacting factor [Hexamita inflata]CAI9975257.1 Nuclear LIM interactor-interacting factor [Hexamita inflata]
MKTISINKFLIDHTRYDSSPIKSPTANNTPIEMPQLRLHERFSEFMQIDEPFKNSNMFKDMFALQPPNRREQIREIRKNFKRKITVKTVAINTKPINENYLPKQDKFKPTLVLDLDSTILFSTQQTSDVKMPNAPETARFNDGLTTSFRAQLYPFLQFCRDNFEVVVWSAGEYDYVQTRMNYCNLADYVDYVLSRNHCKYVNGHYIKDLNRLGRDLKNVVLLDDNFSSCILNVQNCIPVRRYMGQQDDELLQLVIMLRKILEYDCIVRGIETQMDVCRKRMQTCE